MDYHVYLLSRIHERSARGMTTGPPWPRNASTADIITGAASIMVGVFAGFAWAVGHPAADGLRPGHRDVHRRHDHPRRSWAGEHGAPGRPQLVPAQLAGWLPRLDHEGSTEPRTLDDGLVRSPLLRS